MITSLKKATTCPDPRDQNDLVSPLAPRKMRLVSFAERKPSIQNRKMLVSQALPRDLLIRSQITQTRLLNDAVG